MAETNKMLRVLFYIPHDSFLILQLEKTGFILEFKYFSFNILFNELLGKYTFSHVT